MTRVPAPLVTFAAIVLAVAALAVPSSTAAAQGEKDEAFKAGVEARKKQQWPAVVTAMQRAIQEDPKESTRKVGRVMAFGGTEYLPYYMLGEAYFTQGDCVRAVIEWENSIKQGVVQTRPEYHSLLQKGNAACAAKGILLAEKFAAAVIRARAKLASANAAMNGVKEKGSDNLGVWQSQPAFDLNYKRASSEYVAASKRFEEALRSRLASDFDEVANVADRARELSAWLDRELTDAIVKVRGIANEADAVRRSIKNAHDIDAEIETQAKYLDPPLRALRADGQKALENAREQLDSRRVSDSTLAAARSSVNEGAGLLTKVLESLKLASDKERKRTLDNVISLATVAFSRVDAELLALQSLIDGNPAKATPEVRAGTEEARKQLESARRRRDVAIRSQQVAAIETATRQADLVQQKLIELEGLIGVKVERVPQWLRDGATRYLDGDYAGALDRLDDGTVEGPAQLHAYLFRAAAQHALYVRSGEKDTVRRDQAIAEVKRCKELQPTFAPDTRAFSPAFLEFYRRDGAAPQSAARTP